jgi:hypothetical protein
LHILDTHPFRFLFQLNFFEQSHFWYFIVMKAFLLPCFSWWRREIRGIHIIINFFSNV